MNESLDYDGAWKETLELYLHPFLELCFPQVAEEIDWIKGTSFMDQELQEVVRDAALGKQRADKLVKVFCRDGREEWLLIHIEVQSQLDPDLPERIYNYYHRITDRYGCSVVSLVVLADERIDWRPTKYEKERWGCRLEFIYPVCKFLDWVKLSNELNSSQNPVALVIAAHLSAQSTKRDLRRRTGLKWELTRRLFERGYSKEDVLELFRLIDWLRAYPNRLLSSA